jgi:hypothetical protein
LSGYWDQLQPELENEDTKLLKSVKESPFLSYFVLNRFTNLSLSGTLISLIFFIKDISVPPPPPPPHDPVAQRAKGVKQGKLHAESSDITLALKLFMTGKHMRYHFL